MRPCSSLNLVHITWVIRVISNPGIRVAMAWPASPSSPVIGLANITAPTTNIAHPSPLINVWLCQGDRSIKIAHTGQRTPKGGPKGHPNMKEPNRNQFW